jgi:transposase-like protein
MARKRRSKEETKQVDALVERLREFVRLNYLTAAEIAREIGVNDSTAYSWLLGHARPAEPKRVSAFLDSLPRQLQRGASDLGWEGG